MIDPASPIMGLLERWGPSGPRAAAPLADSLAYVRGLATSHYENFSVLSALVPARLRDDFAAVYAFCRWSDDLGDETGTDAAARERSMALLAWWRSELDGCFASLGLPVTPAAAHVHLQAAHASPPGPVWHPVFVALAETVRRHHLPHRLFADLIDAFAQDQVVREYETWEQLLGYCQRSANPVGRLVLMLGGYRPAPVVEGGVEDGRGDDAVGRFAMSDATCTALQLINFWQDVRRDLVDRDRVYLPRAETGLSRDQLRNWLGRGEDPHARVPYIRAVRPLVERTAELFAVGEGLPRTLGPELAPVVGLFGAGGRAVLRAVEAMGCATLWDRPRLSKATKVGLVARAFVASKVGGWLGGGAAAGKGVMVSAGGQRETASTQRRGSMETAA